MLSEFPLFLLCQMMLGVFTCLSTAYLGKKTLASLELSFLPHSASLQI